MIWSLFCGFVRSDTNQLIMDIVDEFSNNYAEHFFRQEQPENTNGFPKKFFNCIIIRPLKLTLLSYKSKNN